MSENIRILIADDHAIVREGLRALIATEPGLEWLDEASDEIQMVDKALVLRPDIILLDMMMPRKDGLGAIRDIINGEPRGTRREPDFVCPSRRGILCRRIHGSVRVSARSLAPAA